MDDFDKAIDESNRQHRLDQWHARVAYLEALNAADIRRNERECSAGKHLQLGESRSIRSKKSDPIEVLGMDGPYHG